MVSTIHVLCNGLVEQPANLVIQAVIADSTVALQTLLKSLISIKGW